MAGASFSEDDLLSHVRGAAPPALRAAVDAREAADLAFAAEIALVQALGPALRKEDAAPHAEAFGWRRLEKAIGRQARRRPAPAPRRLALRRAATLVLGALSLGQAGYIATLPAPDAAPTYRTASEASATHTLGVAFAPGATAQDIGSLLRAVEARVIDGPSPLGFYRVAFASAETLPAGRERLAASPLIDVVATE